MKFTKETKVAALAIVSGTILYLGFNFLKGTDILSSTNTYEVTYPSIDGLTVSNPVMINGLNVGRVSTIQLDQDHGNRLLVRLEIDKAIKLGDSTVALLSNNGLLGTKAIKLHIGPNSVLYEDGATLRGEKEMGLADMVAAKATPVVEHLDSAIVKVNALLGAVPNDKLKTIIINLESASGDLKTIMAKNGENLEAFTGNLAQLSASLVQTEAELKPMIKQFSRFADSLNHLELKATVAKANQAMGNLNDITRKINAGEGTLGALITDKSMYTNLNKTLASFDSLAVDLKYNPHHYFAPLGKKPKKKK
ncbi:MAG: transporter-related permease with domain [Chitinophagaceae bacterium]|nr:transporter-related permease with domain [Chitinophagaceae bacterium]